MRFNINFPRLVTAARLWLDKSSSGGKGLAKGQTETGGQLQGQRRTTLTLLVIATERSTTPVSISLWLTYKNHEIFRVEAPPLIPTAVPGSEKGEHRKTPPLSLPVCPSLPHTLRHHTPSSLGRRLAGLFPSAPFHDPLTSSSSSSSFPHCHCSGCSPSPPPPSPSYHTQNTHICTYWHTYSFCVLAHTHTHTQIYTHS